MSTNYVPAAEPVLDADSLLIDFETRFLMSIKTPVGETWVNRFAYQPGRAFRNLTVRFPIDLTAFGFKEWSGKHEFRRASSEYIDLKIKQWQEGAACDTRLLRDPMSAEIIAWQQREQAVIQSWARLMPSQMYTLLNGGESESTWTGGSAFFATNHNVNPHRTEFGTFSNLLNNGGANASTPFYVVLGGGPFDMLNPWVVLTGEGMGPSIAKAGGGASGISSSAGGPTIIRWGTDSEQFKDTFEVKVSVMAEVGFGLLFPHSIIRNEGDLTYAELKSMLDTAVAMKDLNGYNPADQVYIKAILVSSASQVSTVNGLLGREVVQNNASAPTGAASTIDARLRNVPVIPLAR